jgi:tape measure domain-containing protein
MSDSVNVGSIVITVSGTNDKLRKTFKDSERILNRFDKKTEKVSKNVSNNMAFIGKAAVTYLGFKIAQATGQAIKGIIKTADEVERLKIALISLKRDTDKGLKTFNELDEWAKNMPIRTAEAIDQYRRLTAMGLNPTIERMELITDTVSALGGGVDTFRGLARALGQMASKGKVAGEEMRQLAEHGFPVYDVLKEKLKLSGDQLRDMAKQGVTAKAGLDAIFLAMEEKYGGTARRMMTSWKGLTDIMVDRWWRFYRAITESDQGGGVTLFHEMKAAFLTFIHFFERNYESMAKTVVDIGKTTISVIWDILYGGAQIIDIIGPPLAWMYDNAVVPIFNAWLALPAWAKTLGLLGAIFLGPKVGFVINTVFALGQKFMEMIRMMDWLDMLGDKASQALKISDKKKELEALEIEINKVEKSLRDMSQGTAGTAYADKSVLSTMKKEATELRKEIEKMQKTPYTRGNGPRDLLLDMFDKLEKYADQFNGIDALTGRNFSKATDAMNKWKKDYEETLEYIKSILFKFNNKEKTIVGDFGDSGKGVKDPFANAKKRIQEINMEIAKLHGMFPQMNEEVWELVKKNEEWSLMGKELNGIYLELEGRLAMLDQITKDIVEKNNTWANGVADSMKKFSEGTNTLRKRWEAFTDVTLNSFEQGMVDIFDSATKGFEGWKDIVNSGLTQIYQEMIRIWVVKKLIGGIAGGFGGEATTTGTANTNTNVDHSGTNSGRRRSIPSSSFSNAPRFHNGLRAGEFTAILEKGEEVIPKNQVGKGGVLVQVIDKRGSGAPVGVEQGSGPNGEKQIRVLVEDVMKSAFSSGKMDKTMAANYKNIERRSR